MVEYTSIRVKRDTKEQAQKAKRPSETWDEFILRCSEEPSIHMTEEDIRTLIQKEINRHVVDDARL